MARSSAKAWIAMLAMGVAACGGSDLTGPDGGGGQGGGEPQPVASPSFGTDVNPIFVSGGCTAGSCHGGGADGLTLTSSAATSYANLVNVASTSQPAILRVEPGNPDDSYLVMKLEGRAGSTMPLGGAPLSGAQIGTIRNWIAAGADEN